MVLGQGLFNILDNKEEDGGFHCVAGAHKHLKDWAFATQESKQAKEADDHFNMLDCVYQGEHSIVDPTCMSRDAQRITMRAGSLVCFEHISYNYFTCVKCYYVHLATIAVAPSDPISHFQLLWDYLLPHGSAPNSSSRMRMAQFFKVAPKSLFTDKVPTSCPHVLIIHIILLT